MNPKYNREKGKKFEREIAELMEALSGVHYRRTPNSGGMHQDFPFDIMKRDTKPSIFDGIGNECKNTKQLKIPEWIEQIKVACDDAGLKYEPKWFIAFKNKGEAYFLINKNLFVHLISLIKPTKDDY